MKRLSWIVMAYCLAVGPVTAREKTVVDDDPVIDALVSTNAVTVTKIIDWTVSGFMLVKTDQAPINPAVCSETSTYFLATRNRPFAQQMIHDAMLASRQIELLISDAQCSTGRPVIAGVSLEIPATL